MNFFSRTAYDHFISLQLYKTYKIYRRNIDGPAPASSSSDNSSAADSVESDSSPVRSSPVSSLSQSPFPAVLGGRRKDTPEYYMYRLDVASSRKGLMYLVGMSWIPENIFPYRVVNKGNGNYFAIIPAYVLASLENSSRAIPVDLKK